MMARDYKKEYANYHASPDQKKKRAARNKARRQAVAQGRARKGDGMDVHHLTPLAKGGSLNGPTMVVSKKQNRSFARTKDAKMR
jgi:hypothetical protein